MDNELISIIIPVYNVYQYLDRCVESVVRQTYKNIEIILVDDGSTDGSSEKCDEWAKRDCRIRVVHNNNAGQSAAKNSGIDIARGKYLGFVDSDDYIDSNMYETLHSNASDVDFVTCGIVDEYSDRTVISNCEIDADVVVMNHNQAVAFFLKDKAGGGVSNCSKLWRRELFDTERYVVGQRSEDIDLLWRVLKKTDTVCHVNKAFYHYCHRENSITTKPIAMEIFDMIDIVDVIFDDVFCNYPFAKKEVCSYWLTSYMHVLQRIYQSDYANNFSDRQFQMESILRKRMLYVVISPIHWWTKIVAIAAAFHKGKEAIVVLHKIGNVIFMRQR